MNKIFLNRNLYLRKKFYIFTNYTIKPEFEINEMNFLTN